MMAKTVRIIEIETLAEEEEGMLTPGF